MKGRHQGRNPKVVIPAHRVHPDQVLSLAVVVGPARVPSQIHEASTGLRSVHSRSASMGSVEVLSGEASGGDEDDDDALYSANEGDVSQGSMSLLDISVSDDEDTRKHKARELAL